MAFDSAYCDVLPVANSTLRRFDGRYWHLDFPLNSIATIVSTTAEQLDVNCEFRSNRDLVGLLWTSEDVNGHPLLQYVQDNNYTGLKLGFVCNPADPYIFSMTAQAMGGALVYRMFPYMVSGGSLVPNVRVGDDGWYQDDDGDWHPYPNNDNLVGGGPGTTYAISSIFPDGLPGLPDGFSYFVLDFDNLVTGYNYDGVRIDPSSILQFFFSITPPSYGLGPNANVETVGDVAYDGSERMRIYDTGYATHFQINNVNPNLRLRKGDWIQITLSSPGQFIKTKKKKRNSYSIYSLKTETITIQCDEWYGDGSDKRFIKISNGPLDGAVWIGGKAQIVRLGYDTAIGAESVYFSMRGMSLTGARRLLGRRFYPAPVHHMQMTSGFDDTYNITPWRQVDNTYNLGYRGHFTIYMGMSHYFKAVSYGGYSTFVNQVSKYEPEPLNFPTEVWCRSLFGQMQAYGYTFIWSTSFEILNSYMPPEWKQRDAFGKEALSGWVPPSSFIQPTNVECNDYMARVIKHGLKLLSESGITHLMFQIGEPWWWDGSYTNGAPCIYDELTKSMYTAETGHAVPTPYYTDYRQPITSAQLPYLNWLGMKLGQSTNYIRDSVKAAYPASEATLLFFTPQIMNPASEMLPIINFPKAEWVYPNYDFVQIEDYDWIINGELDLLPLTLQAATVELNYPLSVVHYFVGFVNTARETWVWPNVNIATKEAILNEIPNIYVWAYPQVIRDGITYDDTLYGTQPAIQPPLPKRRQVDEAIGDAMIRPIYFCQVGDDTFMNSSDKNIDFDSKTWFATGSFGKIDVMTEGLTATDSGWSMGLSGIPLDQIDYVTDHLRTKAVKLYLGLADASNMLLSPPRLIGFGEILDNNVLFDQKSATIKINVRSGLSDWHNASSARYTDEYQQFLYPGDRGMRFIADLQNTKLKWGG